MRTLPRFVLLLLAAALVGCTFLPWVGDVPAREVAVRSLASTKEPLASGWVTSLALPICVAAVLALLGALFGRRAWSVIGGLLAVALVADWLLVNVLTGENAVALSRLGTGAWGTLAVGILLLFVSALAADTRTPTVR